MATHPASPWTTLVEYDRPPLVETVLAIHFKAHPVLSSVGMVEFWSEQLRSEFPNAEEQARYEVPIERFDSHPQLSGELRLTMGHPPPRFWFSSDDRRHLVQLQGDWLAFNWRKVSDSHYERYPSGLSELVDVWERLRGFVDRKGKAALNPVQCEVTYVNHLPRGDNVAAPLSQFIRIIGDNKDRDLLPPEESMNFESRYVIRNVAGKSIGRLHVACEPSLLRSPEQQPIYVVTLTARGRPDSTTTDGLVDFLNLGHDWIVGAFDEITTDSMHEYWGRKDRHDAANH